MNRWLEMSWYIKTEYKKEEDTQDGYYETSDGFKIYQYGLLENLTRYCGMSVEDVYGELAEC